VTGYSAPWVGWIVQSPSNREAVGSLSLPDCDTTETSKSRIARTPERQNARQPNVYQQVKQPKDFGHTLSRHKANGAFWRRYALAVTPMKPPTSGF